MLKVSDLQCLKYAIQLINENRQDIFLLYHQLVILNSITTECSGVSATVMCVLLTFIGPCITNIFSEYNQQDMTFLNLFIYVRRSTCFRRFLSPSSGAQNYTYSVRHLSDQYCYLLLAWLGRNWFTCKLVSEFMVTVYCECQPFSEMSALCGNWLCCCIGGKRCSHLKLGRSVTGKSVQMNYKS